MWKLKRGRMWSYISIFTVILVAAVHIIGGRSSDIEWQLNRILDTVEQAEDAEFIWAVSLADLGLDGRPELIVTHMGGSSGASPSYVYGLSNCEQIDQLMVDNSLNEDGSSLAVWQNKNSGQRFYLNQGMYQGGRLSRWSYVFMIDDFDTSLSEFACNRLFLYHIEEGIENLEGGTSVEQFTINNEPVSDAEYYAAYESFFATVSKVEGSEVVLLDYCNLERKELVAKLMEQARQLSEL